MDIQKALETIKRGTLEIISEEQLKEKLLLDRPLRIKFGADPTAPDIHLGHTVILRKLRQLQDLGHKLIFIIGDFTARIGDPSGRDVTRPPLSQEEIEENAATYKEQVFKIVDRERTEIVYNSQWLDRLGTEGMIRLASHYTVARMLERDDFKKRYESQKEITILEFLYPLLQGYDSVHLKADIEVGGGDQKFNLLVGRELQRDYNQKPQAIITLPLLEGTDGVRKMSKSYGNYIGVDEEPKEMFGKIMSLPDALMSKYFELLTDIPLEEVEGLHPKEAKKL
ncbi:tyrosine--tRNA ligase, partial [bacterium]|nr:tyrosine--tRNA ligase [bacterium]MBU1613779.1 tyrosine--tRNA ligase [bacterium]